MMYPFMTLNDDTEITHSEMKSDIIVKRRKKDYPKKKVRIIL